LLLALKKIKGPLSMLERIENLKLYFGGVFSVQLQVARGNTNLCGKNVDGLGSLALCNLDITNFTRVSASLWSEERMLGEKLTLAHHLSTPA
jgi:hypothetical protein